MPHDEPVNTTSSRLGRVAERPWVRTIVVALVAITAYTIGAAYLSLGPLPDQTSVMVVGGKGLRAGSWGAFRVSAHGNQSHTAQAVHIGGARVNGAPVSLNVAGEDPAIVKIEVPASTPRFATIDLDIRTGERTETLTLQSKVAQPPFGKGDGAEVPEFRTPKARHQVNLLPEDGVLVLGMLNRLYLQVLTQAGTPAAKVEVHVNHPLLPEGTIRLQTDALGLATFKLRASQPTLRIGTEVHDGFPHTFSSDLLRPLGRRMRVKPEQVVTPIGGSCVVTLESWQAEALLFCDLVDEEGRWLDSTALTTQDHVGRWELGALPRGAYDVQCYDHPLAPGDAFSTCPLFVSDEGTLDVLRDELVQRGWARPITLQTEDGQISTLSAGFMTAKLRRPPTFPRVLLSTVDRDRSVAKASHDATKGRLLMAMSALFLVVILWVIDAITRNVIHTRRRMHDFTVAALAEREDSSPSAEAAWLVSRPANDLRFTRTRGVLLVLMIGITILLNVLALLGFFALIR
jgi:hypothetical protein